MEVYIGIFVSVNNMGVMLAFTKISRAWVG